MSKEWSLKNPTYEVFCARYSHRNWEYISERSEECYEKENPALVALNDIYNNRDAARTWMQEQVTAYALTRSERTETIRMAIPLFSANFSKVVGRYHILEIMLFFARLSAGMYKTYGKFELKQIGEAWQEFLEERRTEMEDIEHRKNLERAERIHEEIITNGMTEDEWHGFKPFDEAGYSFDFYKQYAQWLERWHFNDYRPFAKEYFVDDDQKRPYDNADVWHHNQR